MAGTKILWGQITAVSLIVLMTVWGATQWTAWRLGFQAQLGNPWFELAGWPVYPPPAFFWWWYFYDAYARSIFYEGAVIAYNSVNKSGAMVVLNALLSPEMQASKCDPKGWGSLPVYEMDIVTEEALTPFKSIKLKGTTVKALEYIEAAKPEFSPQMIAVILAEWERRISAGE